MERGAGERVERGPGEGWRGDQVRAWRGGQVRGGEGTVQGGRGEGTRGGVWEVAQGQGQSLLQVSTPPPRALEEGAAVWGPSVSWLSWMVGGNSRAEASVPGELRGRPGLIPEPTSEGVCKPSRAPGQEGGDS